MTIQCKPIRLSSQLDAPALSRAVTFILGLPDSTLQKIPILPDDFLASEENLWAATGVELSRNVVETLVRKDIGVFFPKGFRVDTFDLKERYLPKLQLFLVGRWLFVKGVDTFIIKSVYAGEGADYYLLPVKDADYLDVLRLAFVAPEYDAHLQGPDYSVRQVDNSIVVFSVDADGARHNERYYSVKQNGCFKLVRRSPQRSLSDDPDVLF